MRISDWSSDVCSSDLPVSKLTLRHWDSSRRCGELRLGRWSGIGPKQIAAVALFRDVGEIVGHPVRDDDVVLDLETLQIEVYARFEQFVLLDQRFVAHNLASLPCDDFLTPTHTAGSSIVSQTTTPMGKSA